MGETIDTDQVKKATDDFKEAVKQAEKAIENVPEPYRSQFRAQIKNITSALNRQDASKLTTIMSDLSTFVQDAGGTKP